MTMAKTVGDQVLRRMRNGKLGHAVQTTPKGWRVRKWPVFDSKGMKTDQFRYTVTDSRGHGLFQGMTYDDHGQTLQNLVAASFTPELLEALRLLRAFAGMNTRYGVPSDVLGEFDGILEGGAESIAQFTGNLLSRIGVEVRQAQERDVQ